MNTNDLRARMRIIATDYEPGSILRKTIEDVIAALARKEEGREAIETNYGSASGGAGDGRASGSTPQAQGYANGFDSRRSHPAPPSAGEGDDDWLLHLGALVCAGKDRDASRADQEAAIDKAHTALYGAIRRLATLAEEGWVNCGKCRSPGSCGLTENCFGGHKDNG